MADTQNIPDAEKAIGNETRAADNGNQLDSSPEKADVPEAEKATKDEPKEKEGGLKDYFRIFRYADRLDRLLYATAFTCAIIVGASLPLMTLIFGSATTTFSGVEGGSRASRDFTHRIDHLVLYFVYLFVGRFVINYIGTLCISIAATRTTRSMRRAFLESTLRQEVAHFDKQGNGSTASQVTTNGNRINQGIAEKLFTCIQGISLFFAAYVVALAVQWKLALITMTVLPAIFLSFGICIAIDAPIEARIVRIYSQAAVLAQDAISSIKTIHAFGSQQKIINKYDEFLQRAHTEGKKKSPIYGVMFCTQVFLVLSGTALAFWEGFRLFQSGEIGSVGTVFTVVLSVTLGATSVMLIFPQIQSITNASSAASELFSIIDKPSTLDPLSPEGMKPSQCTGDIVIRDLRFAYPARPTAEVLQDLSFSIPAGKSTALVGPSGCGKSTVVGLLERWYQPTSGQILLDGHEISEYNTKWLRSNIRLVQQEPILFQGTVFQNVVKGLVGEQLNLPAEKQMELVKEACISSNAHDFIMELPEGYDTPVGERASMLSGGQRQRIAIARSIISDPKVLLLDEATSALDPRAERDVQNALNQVSANKTTLIIAHKLATVMAADNIAVMANGKVVEQGKHNELLELDGLYAAMVRAQDLGAGLADMESPEESDETQHGKEGLPSATLQRTRSSAPMENSQAATDRLVAGTVGYSLLKCVSIMLREHLDLYFWYLIVFVAALIAGGTYPAQAIIFSRIIGVFTLQGNEAHRQADFWSLMFFVLALANLVSYFANGWACNTIGQVITHRYRKEMVERMVYLDQDFFDRPENSSGALTSNLSSAPSALQELMSANLGLMITVLVNVASTSILGIVYGWKLGLVIVFGGLSILIVAGYLRIRLDQKLETITDKQFSSSAGLATEAVTSIRTISMLTLETSILREYEDAMADIVARVVRSRVCLHCFLTSYAVRTSSPTQSHSIDFLIMALGFWYGSQLIADGEYGVTQFFVIFIAIVFGGQGTAQFFSYSTSITKAKLAANYILWLRTLQADIRDDDHNRENGPSDGPVGIEDVEFRYKQRDAKVLRGVSMKIEAGTYAAFVGPSGCGKSTLVSLLERFYDPTSGCITLDNEDISTLSPSLYRRHLSLVQQEPPLYLGSVRENITIGLEGEPSDEVIYDACREANAFDFITSLPEGLNTPCGLKGLQFSGGQRQRIAVARALIRKPRILLLDEATSALDTQSERIVQKALDEATASSGRTTIAVAHRLSTIRHANVIFVIADGKITEMGTHEELQKLRGRYYAMCLAQSLDQA